MRINTGQGTVTVLALISILSVSLVVNLPGCALTPVFGELQQVLPDATESSVQLLSILPNFVIIPFMLLAGWISTRGHTKLLVFSGLAVFILATVLYMFSKSMMMLIWVSCILGVGAGLLIPLSTGLIADVFLGKQRVKMMGWQSGISNIILVIATYVVGWLGKSADWHLPFVVYFIAVIPLVLMPWLVDKSRPYGQGGESAEEVAKLKAQLAAAQAASVDSKPGNDKVAGGFVMGRIWGISIVYFVITLFSMAVGIYMPFLMDHRGIGTTEVGAATAIYFLTIFFSGMFLPYILKGCKSVTVFVTVIFMIVGMIFIVAFSTFWLMLIGCIILGLGYGTYQPILFDKAPEAVTKPSKITLSLSILLTANYLALSVGVYLLDAINDIFGKTSVMATNTFPFVTCCVLGVAMAVLALVGRKWFIFATGKQMYS